MEKVISLYVNNLKKYAKHKIAKYNGNRGNIMVGGISTIEVLNRIEDSIGHLNSAVISPEQIQKAEKISNEASNLANTIRNTKVTEIDGFDNALEMLGTRINRANNNIVANTTRSRIFVPDPIDLAKVRWNSNLQEIVTGLKGEIDNVENNENSANVSQLIDNIKNTITERIKNINDATIQMIEIGHMLERNRGDVEKKFELSLPNPIYKFVELKELIRFGEKKGFTAEVTLLKACNGYDDLRKLTPQQLPSFVTAFKDISYGGFIGNYPPEFDGEYNYRIEASGFVSKGKIGGPTQSPINEMKKYLEQLHEPNLENVQKEKEETTTPNEQQESENIEEIKITTRTPPPAPSPESPSTGPTGSSSGSSSSVIVKIPPIPPEIDTIPISTTNKDIGPNVRQLLVEVDKYNTVLRKYKKIVKNYNKHYNFLVAYLNFMVLVATNTIFIKNYVIFQYLPKSMIIFYHQITTKLLKKMNDANYSNNPVIKFMKSKYYYVVRVVDSFLEKLEGPMEIYDVIDCVRTEREEKRMQMQQSQINGMNFARCMLLLNNFVHILDSYKEIDLSKVTFYSRINDFGTLTLPKMFMSGTELKGHDQRIGPFLTKEKIVPETVLFVDQRQCPQLQGTTPPQNASPQIYGYDKYNFTQVFDSTDYVEMSSIGKNIGLATQLGAGKAICLTTSGYSGSGKTTTLFGMNGQPGLLQVAISYINDLTRLKFRAFEIYGYGLAYPHYWGSGTETRINDIGHIIIHINTIFDNDTLSVDSSEPIKVKSASQIKQYVADSESLWGGANSNENSYVTIDGPKAVGKVIKEFGVYVNSVEEMRKNGNDIIVNGVSWGNIKRIKPTPNNKVSSRSVMVYDFEIYNESTKKFVPLLIIDPPGRESIDSTYVNPYCGNLFFDQTNQLRINIGQTMVNILSGAFRDTGVKINDVIQRLRLMFLLTALNPIALPLFEIDQQKENQPVTEKFGQGPNDQHIFKNPTFSFSQQIADLENVKDIKIPLTGIVDEIHRQTSEIEIKPAPSNVNAMFGNKQMTFIRSKELQSGHYLIGEQSLGGGRHKIVGYYDPATPTNFGFTAKQEIVNTRGATMESIKIGSNLYGYEKEKSDQTKIQYQTLKSIHYMNRLIMTGRWGKFREIVKHIYDINYNNHIRKFVAGLSQQTAHDNLKMLKNDGFMSSLISDKLSEGQQTTTTTTSTTTPPPAELDYKKILEDVLVIDDPLTSLEGIYINETIVGFMKYLEQKMIVQGAKNSKKKSVIKPQDMTFTFDVQQRALRTWLITDSSLFSPETQPTGSSSTGTTLNVYQFFGYDMKSNNALKSPTQLLKYENGQFSLDMGAVTQLAFEYNRSYEYTKIYNEENPLMKLTLESYLDPKGINGYTGIGNYKTLHVVSNHSSASIGLKCKQQYGLLEETKTFIETIVSS